jgi:hypothetical protein
MKTVLLESAACALGITAVVMLVVSTILDFLLNDHLKRTVAQLHSTLTCMVAAMLDHPYNTNFARFRSPDSALSAWISETRDGKAIGSGINESEDWKRFLTWLFARPKKGD